MEHRCTEGTGIRQRKGGGGGGGGGGDEGRIVQLSRKCALPGLHIGVEKEWGCPC